MEKGSFGPIYNCVLCGRKDFAGEVALYEHCKECLAKEDAERLRRTKVASEEASENCGVIKGPTKKDSSLALTGR